MSGWSDQLLTWLLLYGYPVLFLIVLTGSVGVPIPTDIMLIAAGGFVAQGDFNLATVIALTFCAALLGDLVVFGVVRIGGAELVHRHGPRIGLGKDRLDGASSRLGRWMGLGVFTTRWLLTPLAMPTSVLAGLSRYPAARFGLYAALGELLWTGTYVGVGFFFGESWPGILETVQDSAGFLAGLGLTAIAAVALVVLLTRAAAPARR